MSSIHEKTVSDSFPTKETNKVPRKEGEIHQTQEVEASTISAIGETATRTLTSVKTEEVAKDIATLSSSQVTEPEKKISTDDLLKDLVSNPQSCLIRPNPGSTKSIMKGHEHIYECSCKSFFVRSGNEISDLRLKMENSLIRKIKMKFPLPQEKPITICSFASAGCFQELVLHAKLTDLGYKVNWVLVDPIYFEPQKGDVSKPIQGSPESHPTIKQFTNLISEISKSSKDKPTCEVYSDYKQILKREGGGFLKKEPKVSPDVFLLIDSELNAEVEVDAKLLKNDPNFDSTIKIEKKPITITQAKHIELLIIKRNRRSNKDKTQIFVTAEKVIGLKAFSSTQGIKVFFKGKEVDE